MDADRAATALTDRALLPLVDASALDHAVRSAVGVSGQSDVGRYGTAVGRRGRWAVLALSGLSFACAVPALFVLLLAPTIGPHVDLSPSEGPWGVVVAEGLVAVAALLAVAVTARRHGVAVAAAVNAGLVAVVVARLDAVPAMVVLLGIGASLASVGMVVLRPLVVDVAPPEARVRALARWRGGALLGAAAAAALAALSMGGPEWGWRTGLTVAGAAAVILGVLGALVDDPGIGGFENRRLARLVEGDAPGPPARTGRWFRRALGVPAVRRTIPGYLGVGLAGLASIGATSAVVQTRGLDVPETYLGLAAAWTAAAVVVWPGARMLERLRRHSPARLAAAAPVLLLLAAAGLVAVGLSPRALGALGGTALVAAGATLALAALDGTALSAARPPERTAVSAVTAASVALGAVAGLVWFAVPAHQDVNGDLVAWLAVPVASCALLLAWLPRAAARALDQLVAGVSAKVPAGETGDVVASHAAPAGPVLPSPESVAVATIAEPDDAYGGRHRAGEADEGDEGDEGDEPTVRVEPAAVELATVEHVVDVVDVREVAVVPHAIATADAPTTETQRVVEAAEASAEPGSPPPPSAGVELTVRLVPTTTALNAAAGAPAVDDPVSRGPVGSRPGPAGRVGVLDAQAVTVAYGSVQVVVDVDLRLAAGETVALIGPAGVGRAALLRVLAGVGPPSSGRVLLDGEDVSLPPVFPRAPLDLAEIVRGRPLLGSMTVAENLRMYGFMVGHDKAEVDARTAVAFEVYPQLADRRDQLASTLSGADRQRVALARSILAAPSVLLVEPESLWLRPVVAAEVVRVLSRLREDGTGLLLVAESSEALPLAVDRAYLLTRGRVTEQRLPVPSE